MPKKADYSPSILCRYSELNDIPDEQWDSFFPNTGKPWSQSDLQYLIDWWDREDHISLSYALGRPPWGLQRQVCKLRRLGIADIAYLRIDKPKEREPELMLS